MVHSGYEASGAYYTFSSWKGFAETALATLFSKYEDRGALDLLNAPAPAAHTPLVQIASRVSTPQEQNQTQGTTV